MCGPWCRGEAPGVDERHGATDRTHDPRGDVRTRVVLAVPGARVGVARGRRGDLPGLGGFHLLAQLLLELIERLLGRAELRLHRGLLGGDLRDHLLLLGLANLELAPLVVEVVGDDANRSADASSRALVRARSFSRRTSSSGSPPRSGTRRQRACPGRRTPGPLAPSPRSAVPPPRSGPPRSVPRGRRPWRSAPRDGRWPPRTELPRRPRIAAPRPPGYERRRWGRRRRSRPEPRPRSPASRPRARRTLPCVRRTAGHERPRQMTCPTSTT